jgi:hypothetical protein
VLMCCAVQGNSKLLGDFLHNIGDHRSDHDVQYGSHIRWAPYNGLRMASGGHVHSHSGPIDG